MVQAVVLLAEGYEFTDTLTSPYRIAYGHIKSTYSKRVWKNSALALAGH
ncbi:MAG TPA: hypothetical protein VFB21_14965 [Chthonomonadaceae bacterium]|nr:hypothetical protein [Chthonomonadaceae bacterium]